MKNKNLLAENILRFKAKNLSETAKRNIVELARIIIEQKIDINALTTTPQPWNGAVTADDFKTMFRDKLQVSFYDVKITKSQIKKLEPKPPLNASGVQYNATVIADGIPMQIEAWVSGGNSGFRMSVNWKAVEKTNPELMNQVNNKFRAIGAINPAVNAQYKTLDTNNVMKYLPLLYTKLLPELKAFVQPTK